MAVALDGSADHRLADTRQVVAAYKDMVYGIAATHTRCRADADDVFQDVFLTYHRKRPAVRDGEHLKAWLIRTTLTIARRHAGTSWSRRQVPMATDELPEPPSPAGHGQDFTFRTQAQDAIFRAMRALPEAGRTAVYLHYFEDMPVAAIAAALNAEEGAVKMRLSRARQQLREQLSGEDFHD
jgi:RNA polymerase sigma-70 factor (ECF subfamily)